MALVCIRGAITVEQNEKEDILSATEELINSIIKYNNLDNDEVMSITFTATDDINKAYPAVAARKLGFTSAAIMCLQEMNVQGSLRMCIRVMIQVDSDRKQKEVKHIYLKGAQVLRPDLTGAVDTGL